MFSFRPIYLVGVEQTRKKVEKKEIELNRRQYFIIEHFIGYWLCWQLCRVVACSPLYRCALDSFNVPFIETQIFLEFTEQWQPHLPSTIDSLEKQTLVQTMSHDSFRRVLGEGLSCGRFSVCIGISFQKIDYLSFHHSFVCTWHTITWASHDVIIWKIRKTAEPKVYPCRRGSSCTSCAIVATKIFVHLFNWAEISGDKIEREKELSSTPQW